MGIIKGIGIDIVEVQRIQEILEKQDKYFTEKIFSDMEITYCRTRNKPYIHFAARFAAKEAVAKAMRTGWSGEFRWKDVEVVNDQSGAPHIILCREVKKALEECDIHLSISHTNNIVAAFVVIESKKM